MTDTYEAHRDRVQQIAEKVKDARQRHEQPTIYHGSDHSVRPTDYSDDERIHVERLDHFIDVDEDAGTVVMEPDITMRELVDEALEHGLVPKVVPEFPTITVGGAIQGGAGESSSFRCGLVHQTCDRLELVTGEGDIVQATAEENSDLFHGTACSYGSLGILTQVRMELEPASEYVRLTYHPVDGFEDALDLLQETTGQDIDYLDAIMFGPDHGVVMVGEQTDGSEDLPVERFTRARDEWFYLHARDVSQHDQHQELVPIRDYFFRYDIGAFWAIRNGFEELHMPFNRVTRTLLHPFMNTAAGYDSGIHGANLSSVYIIQDLLTPQENTLELLEWVDGRIGVYPLWLLPIIPDADARLSPNHQDTDLIINIGIWGPPATDEDPETLKHDLEDEATRLGARKTLYAQQFYTEDDFWDIYDQEWYDGLREEYGASGVFHNVYEVTHVDELPTPRLVDGIIPMWRSVLGLND